MARTAGAKKKTKTVPPTGDVGGTIKRAPAKRGAKDPDGFPFLFYGRLSADFGDAVTGHPYELRFVEAPNVVARIAIAKVFARATHGTLVTPPPANQPWLWAGDWALLVLFESPDTPPPEEPGFLRYFADVEKVLRAIHAAHPVAEVVYGEARTHGQHPWDRFTEAQQPAPSRHPPFGPYRRAFGVAAGRELPVTADPSLPPGAPDPAFEAARATAETEFLRAEVAKRRAKVAAKGGIAWALANADDLPRTPEPPAWVNAACDALDPSRPRQVERLPSGAWIALLSPDARRNVLALLDAEGQAPRLVELPRLEGRRVFRLRPDGFAVLYAEEHNLYEIALPEGRPRVLWHVERTTAEAWVEAIYLTDGRIGVITRLGLHVLQHEGDGARRVDFVKVAGAYHELAVTENGRFILATSITGPVKATVLGVRGAEIRSLGALKQAARDPFARSDRLFCSDSKGNLGEIVNLKPAYETAFAEHRPSPRAALAAEAATLLRMGEVALVPMEAGSIPPAAPIPASVRAHLEGALWTRVEPGAMGSFIALAQRGRDDVRVAVFTSTADAPHWIDLPPGAYRLFDVSPDGARAIVAAVPPNDVFEIALPTGEARWLMRKVLRGAARAPGNRLVLLDVWDLELDATVDGRLEKIASVSLEGQDLTSTLGGRVVLARTPTGDLTAYSTGRAPLASIKLPKFEVARVFRRGESAFATVHGVDCAIENLDRAIAAIG